MQSTDTFYEDLKNKKKEDSMKGEPQEKASEWLIESSNRPPKEWYEKIGQYINIKNDLDLLKVKKFITERILKG